jgi:mercuric ion transport protein
MFDRRTFTAQSAAAPSSGRSGLDEQTKKTIFASGSVLGALAMSSCCILPLVLFSLGVTGAWIGNLTALYPYKPIFFVITAVFLAGGFYKIYRKPKASACEVGSYCSAPISDRINKITLWSATILVVAALAFPYVAPALLDY